jgi:hypothetical protein
MLNDAARSFDRHPAIKFKEVGDKFQATVQSRNIREIQPPDKEKDKVKTLIIELELTEPRTQTFSKLNVASGFYEDEVVTDTHWVWFVRENTQILTELSRAIKEAGGPSGSPFQGDQVRVKLIGLKPSSKGPKPMQVTEITYKSVAAPVEPVLAPTPPPAAAPPTAIQAALAVDEDF